MVVPHFGGTCQNFTFLKSLQEEAKLYFELAPDICFAPTEAGWNASTMMDECGYK